MTKLAMALASCLSFLTLGAQSYTPASLQAEYSRAEALVRNHQWDDGLSILIPLLTADPRNVKALNLAGLAYEGKGDPQKATGYFEKCLQVSPEFLPAMKNLSINEFNSHQYEIAEERFLRVEKALPDDPVVQMFLGQIAYREHKFKEAANHLSHSQSLVLHNPNLTASLIVSLLRSNQQQSALDLLDRVMASDMSPSNLDPESQLALGISLAELNLDNRAVPFLQAAFQHDEASYNIGFDLTLTSIHARDFATAIATSEKLVKNGHDTAELEDIRAEALESHGETQRAVDAYRRAIALDAEDENTYLDFASLCIDHRAFDDGMKVIAVGLQVHPKSEQLTFMHGILNAMQDHFELAEDDFRKAALFAPQNDFGYIGLGVTYLELGNSEKAIQVIRERLRQMPNDASLLYLLGEGLLRSGAVQGQPEFAEAQTTLERSISLNPRLCLPHISLGSIYLDEERWSEAAAQFEQARAIDQNENSAYSHLAIAYRHLGQQEKAKEVLTSLKQLLIQQRAGMRVKDEALSEH
jgi:tetratricopeptide (TPR) repeat protein